MSPANGLWLHYNNYHDNDCARVLYTIVYYQRYILHRRGDNLCLNIFTLQCLSVKCVAARPRDVAHPPRRSRQTLPRHALTP